MTNQKLAEDMLHTLTSSLLETADHDRFFSDDEFYAITNCYELAKPHISESFERQWCGDVITWLDRNDIKGDGELYDSFTDFMRIMIPNRTEKKS